MSDYGSIITTAGAALEAAAIAGGAPVQLTEFVVGDGNGSDVVPDPAQTALVHEVYRGSISSLSISADQASQMIAEIIIPKDSGGYTIRELGLLAADGTLYSVANYPAQVKPAPDSGTAIKLDMQYSLAVSDTTAITLLFDSDDYLTETQANTLYLRIDANLSEIATAGAAAQSSARSNLGLTDMSIANPADYVKTTGGDVGYLDNATHYGIKPGTWEGVGAIATQYADPTAPFVIPKGFTAMSGASQFNPIIKGVIGTDVVGYFAAISLGALTSGGANYPNLALSITTDTGTSAVWAFDPNTGTFSCPGPLYGAAGLQVTGGDNVTSGANVVASHAAGDAGGGAYFIQDAAGNNIASLSADTAGNIIINSYLATPSLSMNGYFHAASSVSIGSPPQGEFLTSPGINIGDSDSGLISTADGVVSFYANGLNVGRWNSTSLQYEGDIVARGGLYESGGSVRAYSLNNPPPQDTAGGVNSYVLAAFWDQLALGALVDGASIYSGSVRAANNYSDDSANLWTAGPMSGTWMMMGSITSPGSGDYWNLSLFLRVA